MSKLFVMKLKAVLKNQKLLAIIFGGSILGAAGSQAALAGSDSN